MLISAALARAASLRAEREAIQESRCLSWIAASASPPRNDAHRSTWFKSRKRFTRPTASSIGRVECLRHRRDAMQTAISQIGERGADGAPLGKDDLLPCAARAFAATSLYRS